VQLAETLGILQQTMNAYEMGHRRVPVSALTLLATRSVYPFSNRRSAEVVQSAMGEPWREYHDRLSTQYAEGGGAAWNARLEVLSSPSRPICA
jgi:hypothetical protein